MKKRVISILRKSVAGILAVAMTVSCGGASEYIVAAAETETATESESGQVNVSQDETSESGSLPVSSEAAVSSETSTGGGESEAEGEGSNEQAASGTTDGAADSGEGSDEAETGTDNATAAKGSAETSDSAEQAPSEVTTESNNLTETGDISDKSENSNENDEISSEVSYPSFYSHVISDNSVEVTAYAGEGVLPQGTVMYVTPAAADAVRLAVQDELDETDSVVVDLIAVDISFIADGKEIEPSGNINIKIDSPRKVEGEAQLWHVDDNMKAEQVEASVGKDDVQFTSDDFSIYAIVGTEARGSRVYKFYNGSELLYSQTVKNGDVLVAPENPVYAADPSKPFKGWSADGGETFVEFDQLKRTISDIEDDAEGSEVNLYAVYGNTFSVTFYNTDGGILTEEQVEAGTVIDPSEMKCEIAEGSYVNAWTQDPDKDWSKQNQISGETSVTVNANLKFYPIIKGITWVFFNDNADGDEATYIDPVPVPWGSTLAAPEAPARRGYTFKEWTLDSAGDTPYDFTSELPVKYSNSVLQLYAVWDNAQTTYTVEIWVEACQAGNYIPGNYKQKYSFTADGLTGDKLNPETVLSLAKEKEQKYVADFTDKYSDSESLQYRDINSEVSNAKNKDVIIKGDGSTVAYVYYDMRKYEFQFAPGDRYGTFNNAPDEWLVTFVADGKTYTYSNKTGKADGTLIVRLHPGEYTTSLPHDIIATNQKTGETRQPLGLFTWWLEQYNQNKIVFTDNTLYDLPDFVNGRSYIPMEFYWQKTNTRQNRWSHVAFASSMADFTIHRYFETQTTGEYEDRPYTSNTASWYNWGPMNYRGFVTLEPKEVPDELREKYNTNHRRDNGKIEDLTNYKVSNSVHTYYYFFNRRSYNLYFYNDGTLLKSYTNSDENAEDHRIKYQASFQDLLFTPEKPEKYKSGDYIFAGWSAEDPEGAVITDYTMPANDVTLYAVWKAKNVTITVDTNGGTFADQSTQKVIEMSPGQKLPDLEMPVRTGFKFLGWVEEGGSSFSADTLIYHDVKLYASWIYKGEITIQYDDLQGNIQKSNKKYSEAAYAIVNYTPASRPDGKLFAGWVYGGTTYWNGQTIVALSRNAQKVSDTEFAITLTAEYTDAAESVSLRYDPNGGTGGKTFTYQKYAVIEIADQKESAVSRDGYKLTGWNTKPDGSGDSWDIDTKASLDKKDPFPNVLYAVWEKAAETEKSTEKTDEKSTEKSSEKADEKTTEKTSVKTTEKTTEKSTERETGQESPKTGDSSPLLSLTILMLAALAGIAVITAGMKRRRI